MRLGLYGKLYNDTYYSASSIQLGESVSITLLQTGLGGMYNFPSLHNLDYQFNINGACKVDIIESNGIRTAFRHLNEESWGVSKNIDDKDIDWLHICYIDDCVWPNNINTLKVPFSIDFAFCTNRWLYSHIIDNATLIFDSRERQGLYDKINTKTPIILHDSSGCECRAGDKIIAEVFRPPYTNINVNGAGDIFAASFIREYFYNGMETSLVVANNMTRHLLKAKNEKV
jgi:hypothetical protein